MKNVVDMPGSIDNRPKRLGWAPGGYMNKCSCGSVFIGDKRAIMCADCAYKVSDEEIEKMMFESELNRDMSRLEHAVDTLVEICHKYNAHWWIDPATGEDLRNKPLIIPTKLMLMVSEISEAMEADRKDLMDDKVPDMPGVVVEVGDNLIRTGDIAGAFNWPLGKAVVKKFLVNLVRPDHKAENRVKKGGKKY